MVGWHHQLNGHESEQALGDGEGQGSLACRSPRGHRVRHDWATEQQLRVLSTSLYLPKIQKPPHPCDGSCWNTLSVLLTLQLFPPLGSCNLNCIQTKSQQRFKGVYIQIRKLPAWFSFLESLLSSLNQLLVTLTVSVSIFWLLRPIGPWFSAWTLSALLPKNWEMPHGARMHKIRISVMTL